VFVAIACLLYNFVATFTGGIEVELSPAATANPDRVI
jgi:hypothetical protein